MGRPKGSLNHNKFIVRNIIEEALGQSMPSCLLELAGNNTQRKIDIILDLMPYCYPKLASVEVSATAEIETAIDDEIKQLITWVKEVKELK